MHYSPHHSLATLFLLPEGDSTRAQDALRSDATLRQATVYRTAA